MTAGSSIPGVPLGRKSENMGVLCRRKWGFVAKEALFALQSRLLCMTIKAHLCVKQGSFAMQSSLVCGAATAFSRQNGTFFFAQKRFYLSNDVVISLLRLHAVFCEISAGFPFLRERTDFRAVRNANIIQVPPIPPPSGE